MNEMLPIGAAFFGALALTPAVRLFARATGMVAAPKKDRWHSQPTAMLGGVAIFGAFGIGIAVAIGQSAMSRASLGGREVVGIVAAATLMFLVGLVDDKVQVRPATKLIAQTAAAAILVSNGVIYPATPWMTANVLLTVFWFLALTNAVNLLDNMDGVAVGVSSIAAAFLSLTFMQEGAHALAAVCAILAAAGLGFLPYNFSRASIFMGDSGSLFLGALLAGLGAAFPQRASASIVSVLLVPVLIVIIPIADTLLVTIARTLAGRSISVGGRDHTTHRLVSLGLSESQVALLLYLFAAVGGALALVLGHVGSGLGLALGALFLVGVMVSAAYLGQIDAYGDKVHPTGRVTLLVADLLHKRRALETLLDIVLFAISYQMAFLLRWDGALPMEQSLIFQKTLGLAIATKLIAFGLGGVYRGSWHHLSLSDVHRISLATVGGSLLTIGTIVFVFRDAHFARAIFVIDALVTLLLVVGTRSLFRSLDHVHYALAHVGAPTLIYGAGHAGRVAVRQILAHPDLRLRPVAFIDDRPAVRGRVIQGLPVLGDRSSLLATLRRHSIEVVVYASEPDDGSGGELRELCRGDNIRQLRLKVSLDALTA